MLRKNPEYNMTLCPDSEIRDGEWSDWEIIEKCRGNQKVGSSNLTCGISRTIERKYCNRTLGGKYCKDEKGIDVVDDLSVKTIKCQERECPGITS